MREPLTPAERCAWTVSDGTLLRGRLWRGAGRGGVGILYLHGIQSHGGWYEWSASVLASRGAWVMLPDRRGSGLNEKHRGDTPGVTRWLADLDELADWLRDASGCQSLWVVGVSWGGKLATAWALRGRQSIERLMLIAPGVFPAVDIGLMTRLRVVAALLLNPGWRFEIPLNNPALFTANPDGQAFIRADPQKLTHVTARFLYRSSELDRSLKRLPPRSLKPQTTLVVAGRDRIIRNEPTRRWIERITVQDVQEFVFSGVGHTVEFEKDVSEFEHCLAAWRDG